MGLQESDLQESFESNLACIAFNAFFESNRADGIDLNAFNEWSSKSTNYIYSLKQEYKKKTLKLNDVKTITLHILIQFINDNTDIEFMIIKLLSLCHFLQHEELDEQFLFCHFIFHLIVSIILSCDALKQMELKFEFCINTYFGSNIKRYLIRKCIAVNINILQNKTYISIKNELMPFMNYIECISVMIADFVEYKYFKLIQKMSILFVQCITWENFRKLSNFDWKYRVLPEINRYNLANILGLMSLNGSLQFEMTKVNAYTIIFVHKYKINNNRKTKLPRDAVTGLCLFNAKFSNTSSAARNPLEFIDLVSHFSNENWRIMHDFLCFWMSVDSRSPFTLFVTDDKKRLDFILNEILIKYKVLETAKSALAVIIVFHDDLAASNRYYHDGGKISNNIFQIVYPKYINDKVLNLAKECHNFAENKPGFIRLSRDITRLPRFTAIDLFHEYMEKLTLLS